MTPESNTQNTSTQSSTTQTETFVPREPLSTPQRRSRKKVWFITCGVLLLLVACICSVFTVFSGALFSGGTTTSTGTSNVPITETKVKEYGEGGFFGSQNKIAVIEIAGVVNFSTQSDTSLGTNNRTIIGQLENARNDSAVKAIVLRFNTPGGAVSAAEPICQKIKAIDKEKPVYAFIDAEGASLGYLLPNCARIIYARPDAITGSIGVRADLLDLNGILTNIGARSATITNSAGEQKTQEGLFDKNSAEYKRYQSILDEVYEYFIKTVWEGRKVQDNGLTEAKLRSYGNGQIFSGLQAKQAGLVDETAQYEEVLDAVYEENLDGESAQVVEYTVYVDPFASLFGNLELMGGIFTKEKHSREKLQLMMLSDY